jgi:hypothetical protein
MVRRYLREGKEKAPTQMRASAFLYHRCRKLLPNVPQVVP